MGAVGKVVVDPDGQHVWAVVRCERLEDPSRFGDECRDSKADPIVQFGADGKVTKTFGGGVFIWPHGLDVDREGNVWVTEARGDQPHSKRRQAGAHRRQVQPGGKVLLTLGTARCRGKRPGPLHLAERRRRVAGRRRVRGRWSRRNRQQPDRAVFEGWQVRERLGQDRLGARRVPVHPRDCHGFTWRVFVGDRGNNRIQIFDQDGKSVSTPWTQFGKPSGITFDNKDQIYVADSESDDVQNPGWEEGIRIGDAKSGWVHWFIQFAWGDPRTTAGNGAEFVAVDGTATYTAASRRPSGCRSTFACGRKRRNGRLLIGRWNLQVRRTRHRRRPGHLAIRN
jgi:hypothetical protein